jgi:hypothetical protein
MSTSITANGDNAGEMSDHLDELGSQSSGSDTSMASNTAGTEDTTTKKTNGNNSKKKTQENLPSMPNAVASKRKRTGKAFFH